MDPKREKRWLIIPILEAVVAAKQTDFGEADETLSKALTSQCANPLPPSITSLAAMVPWSVRKTGLWLTNRAQYKGWLLNTGRT